MQEDVPTRPANTSPDDPADSGHTLWLVSYADDDDREMTAEQIFHAMRRGEIDGDTIVWRDGMPEWQAIVDVDPLQRAIGKLAGRGPVDKKRTVMGGFHAAKPPLPSRAPTPEVPPAVQTKAKLPRSTLIGGAHAIQARGLSPAVPTPDVSDLDDTNELDSQLLESVRSGPPDVPHRFPDIPSDTTTAPLADVMRIPMPSDPEPAPISLDADSIESLPSNALESVVAQMPPAEPPSAPKNIFDVASEPPAPIPVPESTLLEPAEPKARPRPPLRDRSVMPVPTTGADLESPEAISLAPPERRGAGGKIVGVIVLLGLIAAAMFYLGRQTAQPTGVNPEPVASTAAAPTTPPDVTAAPAEATTAAEPAPDEPKEEPAEDEAETEAEEDEAETPPTAVAPRPSPRPRTTLPSPRPSPSPVAAPSPKPAPAETPEETTGAAPGPFDTRAASSALTAAASSASSCRKEGDPSGVANVTVTFSPSGRAINANVQGPPFAGTVTGGCIAARMRSARVPPFSGERITVKKVVVIQ